MDAYPRRPDIGLGLTRTVFDQCARDLQIAIGLEQSFRHAGSDLGNDEAFRIRADSAAGFGRSS